MNIRKPKEGRKDLNGSVVFLFTNGWAGVMFIIGPQDRWGRGVC